jgi:hypothetical protein
LEGIKIFRDRGTERVHRGRKFVKTERWGLHRVFLRTRRVIWNGIRYSAFIKSSCMRAKESFNSFDAIIFFV